MIRNNCESCDHKKTPDGGHCYMFRYAPTEPCSRHTIPTLATIASRSIYAQQVFNKLFHVKPKPNAKTPNSNI